MTAKLTTEQFITKAKTIHGDRYDYSLVEYQNNAPKIKIICNKHGSFEQEPRSHLSAQGCKVCANEALSTIAKSEFTTKASHIHNNKYDYSLVEYQNNATKVTITCKSHGSFEQTPGNHLKGKGCAVCASLESGFTRTNFKAKCEKNNNGLGILYVLECFNDNERFYKIGITSNSIKRRYHSKASMPYLYSVVKEIIGDPIEIYDLETKLHQLNKENKYVPSVSFAGHATECFSKYKEIL